MIGSFRKHQGGGVAILFGFSLLPLALMTGAAVDYSRAAHAHSHIQSAVDAAALAAALGPDTKQNTLTRIARNTLTDSSRIPPNVTVQLKSVTYNAAEGTVEVKADGSISSIFMKLINKPQIPFSNTAIATRPGSETIELAMVLDNTWSMSDSAGGGMSKIDALKAAAEDLVNKILDSAKGNAKIAIVPFADYVNVGVSNRGQPWLSVPPDRTDTVPRTCSMQSTRSQCTPSGAQRSCTRTVDGVSETYDCTPYSCQTVAVEPYETCWGGYTVEYKWFGCVGSRTVGTLRLSDQQPSVPYPGFLATGQNCLNPIVPLTVDKPTLVNAIRGLIVNVGGYKPSTFIPGGLIWGVNALSPEAPLVEGAAYSARNTAPRKVIVLMTDGENTMRFEPTDGRHVETGNNGELKGTNDDVGSICSYAKTKKIEIYTIAFAVSNGDAKNMLKSCATDNNHYFDAGSSSALATAFSDIAKALTRTRLKS